MVGMSKKERKEVEKPYRIIPEELPPLARMKQGIYDSLINDVLQMDKGTYRIEVEGKHFKTIYTGLVKRIKDKPLKLHVRKGKVYLERL
jgi:hypothetical protein